MKTPKNSILRIICSAMLVSMVIVVSGSMQSREDAVVIDSVELDQAEQEIELIELNEAIPELTEISGIFILDETSSDLPGTLVYRSSSEDYAELGHDFETYILSYSATDERGDLYTDNVSVSVILFNGEILNDNESNRILVQAAEYLMEKRWARDTEPSYQSISVRPAEV